MEKKFLLLFQIDYFSIYGIQLYNGRPIWRTPSAVYSDASDTGFGSYLVEHGGHVVHGQWTDQEAKKSSTWRELHAVSETFQAVVSKLTNYRIKWFTDNQNVVRMVVKKKSYKRRH